MPTLDEWGTAGPAGGDNPNIPADFEALRDSIRGRFPNYFATKAARDSATATYLARSGNAGDTGMQAYVGELRANTVYLPVVGWRFVSQIIEEGIFQRGYGTGAVAMPVSTFTDSGGLDLTNQLVGTKIRMLTNAFVKVDGNVDQTVLFSFTGSGFSRDTVDSTRRIIGSVSPDKYHMQTDFAQFSITNPTVALRLQMTAGGGTDRLVMLHALHYYTVAHSTPVA
jgi:hypothetical protein